MKSQKQVQTWLYIGCLMIFIMVIIGGITRLTGSGLSITEWNVLMGAIPPLNNEEWLIAFEKYQAFPQFKLVNQHMTITEFKQIFFWEYFHRLWGRLIGIVFILPFIYFIITKKFKSTSSIQLITLFLLGGLQGFVGWYMVKSGLIDKPWVSHYRLSIHLLLALILYSFTLYLGFDLTKFTHKIKQSIASKKALLLSNISIIILAFQIFYGALMAGLKAGLYYPTYPTMNGDWIPSTSELFALDGFLYNLTTNKAMVHVIHRALPVLLGIVIIYLLLHVAKNRKTLYSRSLNKFIYFTLFIYILQFTLGILTVINCLGHIPVVIGVTHQAVAIVLLSGTLLINFRLRKGLSK